jgi:hypothetical protein
MTSVRVAHGVARRGAVKGGRMKETKGGKRRVGAGDFSRALFLSSDEVFVSVDLFGRSGDGAECYEDGEKEAEGKGVR